MLRPEAVASLQGCDHIIHAGDVGGARILEDLAAIAPVVAVRGNNDEGAWAEKLPGSVLVEIGGISIFVLHDLSHLPADIESRGVQVVVSGHSHKPRVASRNGVLYVNPGSAGRRRFKLPVAVGELRIAGGTVTASILPLVLEDDRARSP